MEDQLPHMPPGLDEKEAFNPKVKAMKWPSCRVLTRSCTSYPNHKGFMPLLEHRHRMHSIYLHWYPIEPRKFR
jgi:hypothetical protein